MDKYHSRLKVLKNSSLDSPSLIGDMNQYRDNAAIMGENAFNIPDMLDTKSSESKPSSKSPSPVSKPVKFIHPALCILATNVIYSLSDLQTKYTSRLKRYNSIYRLVHFISSVVCMIVSLTKSAPSEVVALWLISAFFVLLIKAPKDPFVHESQGPTSAIAFISFFAAVSLSLAYDVSLPGSSALALCLVLTLPEVMPNNGSRSLATFLAAVLVLVSPFVNFLLQPPMSDEAAYSAPILATGMAIMWYLSSLIVTSSTQ